jgi:predicted enzyme related to lactoylglutathione lyase
MYISVVTLYVDNVDRAIDFFTQKLGWQKTMDAPMGEGMRWVTVGPSETATTFTLMVPTPEWPDAKVGGNSGVILEADDVFKEHERLTKLGVEFTDGPRNESWGGWAMFKDSEGNVHGLHSTPAGGG